jgi:hypothetical protein
LPDGFGRRRDVLVDKYGTPEGRKECARVLAEWEAGGRRPPQPVVTSTISINELVLAYWKHAIYCGWAKDPQRHGRAAAPDRPEAGEVCRLRGMDLEASGPVWVYRPGSDRGAEGDHKTAHHGHERLS